MSPPFSSMSSFGNAARQQFETLHHDTERFRASVHSSDRDRESVEKESQELQNRLRTLTEHVHDARESLGAFTGQKDQWNKEQARLKRQIDYEREEIVKCSKATDAYKEQETKRQEEYCKSMKATTETHESLLRQYEYARLKALISATTVDILLEKQAEVTNPASGASTTTPPLGNGLAESAALLKDATNTRTQQRAVHDLLQHQLAEFREQVLSSRNVAVSHFVLSVIVGVFSSVLTFLLPIFESSLNNFFKYCAEGYRGGAPPNGGDLERN